LTPIVTKVLVGIVWAAGVGIVISAVALKFSPNKKVASRIVDLASYFIAGTGLAATLLAVGSFENRVSESVELMNIVDASTAAVRKIESTIELVCPIGPDADKTEPKTTECARLPQYGLGLIQLPITRGALLPELSLTPIPKNIDTMKALFDIQEIVSTHNDKMWDFFFTEMKKPLSDYAIDQLMAIIYAAYVVAFAFGMGIVRRSFDTYADFKQRKRSRR